MEAHPVRNPLHMQLLFKACEFYPFAEDGVVSESLFEAGLCLRRGRI